MTSPAESEYEIPRRRCVWPDCMCPSEAQCGEIEQEYSAFRHATVANRNKHYADLKELRQDLAQSRADLERLRQREVALWALVDRQAEDDGLWFMARTAPEAYLQQELRKLHDAIEHGRPAPAEQSQ